jgi:uncharacterized membrane protein YdjX (TVP38/TMEM64 family)
LISLLLLYRLYLDYYPELNLLLHFNHKNEQLLLAKIRNHGWRDLLMLFLVSMLATAIPGMSNSIFCVLNGLLYGPWLGFVINWLAAVSGQLLLLRLLNLVTRRQQTQKSKVFQRLTDSAAASNPYFSLTLAYAIPVIPSVTAAYASIKLLPAWKKRVLPIVCGTLPASFLYAFGGDALLHLDWKRLLIVIICIAILIGLDLLLMWGKRKHASRA